jgi:DNA-binding CsgD family transcriptional regulator
MSSIFARCVGLGDDSNIPPEAAALVVERRSTLSRVEARVVVFDYFGDKRKQLGEKLAVSPETIRTYWKRVYLKTNIRTRDEVRVWVERLLQKELRDEP